MEILSRNELASLVSVYPNQYEAIVIHEVGDRQAVEEIIKNCKNCLVLEMDDCTREARYAPQKEQVLAALGCGFEYVACRMGVSRSSAIAFLIECKNKSPEEAIKILDVKKHFPNELILKYGVDILGEHIRPVIFEYYKKYSAHKGWNIKHITKYFLE